MPRTKLQSFFIIIFFNILYLNSVAPQEEYGGNCKNTDSKQSPINIIPPFTFTNFNGEFQFNSLYEGFLENNNNTLRLEGDFGSIIYGSKVFNTYEINFKSPSEHTIGEDNITLPLEIQISSISEDNSRVNLAILFSHDVEDSSFLYSLGFGKGLLQHLKHAQFLEFKGSISLKEIIPQENKYFMYQGTTTSTPCSQSVWLIAYNTFRISQRQIDDFPRSLAYKRRELQPLKHREIFITFYPGLEKHEEKSNNNTNQTKNESISNKTQRIIPSTENDKMIDGDDDSLFNNQNKDSFKILGDTTIYDFDFYGGETAIKNRGIKYIRNEDYLVVYDKEYIKEIDPTTITIDDKVVDEIIDSLERKNNRTDLFKYNETNELNISHCKNSVNKSSDTNSTNTEKTITENGESNTNITSNSKENISNKTENFDSFFEKDLFDMWTVDKITNSLQIPLGNEGKNEDFAFKKPDQNKVFVNFNKPISFLQIDHKNEVVSPSVSPFFVITEDMIKNSQNNPIIIDANTLQNLISGSNNNNATVKKENKENNSVINEIMTADKNEVTSFVQTKLNGIVKERISDNYYENLKNDDSNLKNMKKIMFDGYIPNDDESVQIEKSSISNEQLKSETSSNSANKERQNIDASSFNDKSPEEMQALKEKMEKILNIIDNKLQDTKKIINTNVDDNSETYTSIKENVNEKVDKTEDNVKNLQGKETKNEEKYQEKNEEKYQEKHEEKHEESSEHITTNDDLNILDSPNDEDSLKKMRKIIENTEKKDNIFPGQGKIATDRAGKWDAITVYNISTWPDKCKYGSYQSPLHIGLSETFFVEPHMVTVDYGKPEDNKIEIFNDGYKLIVKGEFGNIKYGDHELPTKEIYIHHPSEHTFGDDQSRTDFEIQIVHEDKAGAKVIVAVFLHNMGDKEDNQFLEDLGFSRDNEDKWIEYAESTKIQNKNIDLSTLVASIPHYITYDGSLTTPPCTEGVKWIILRKRKKVSQKQINAFQYLFGKMSNVRGTQELGIRKLKIF